LTRYFALPVVPVAFGYDPRLQVLHEADAVEVMRRASTADRPGVFNVAGCGTMLLSQAIRRAGRVAIPVISPAVSMVSNAIRRSGLADFSSDQLQFLNYGRVVDTTRLRTEFDYTPAFTTEQAFDAFVTGAGIRPVIAPHRVARAEELALEVVAVAARVSRGATRLATRDRLTEPARG
jgi:UDP-glucose 4-epimerase